MGKCLAPKWETALSVFPKDTASRYRICSFISLQYVAGKLGLFKYSLKLSQILIICSKSLMPYTSNLSTIFWSVLI